jgi:hypothetical protein
VADPNQFRFRGGVRYIPDEKKWRIILEIDGTQYLDEHQFDTQDEALVVYMEAREEIVRRIGIASGANLEFHTPVGCPWCKAKFNTFNEYDLHVPCKDMPEDETIPNH